MAERPAKSYDEMRPGRFLKAGLLQGKQVTLTIREITIDDTLGDAPEGVVHFEKTPKLLVLNATNKACFRAMFGAEPSDAVGKRVTLYPTRTDAYGDTVDCIRVWGSPDIAGDIVIQVPKGKKGTAKLTLRKVAAAAPVPEQAAPMREPGEEG